MKRFTHLCIGIVVATTLAAGNAKPAPLDPELQRQLLAVYDRYSKAIGAGKVNDALATRTAAARKRLQAALKNRKERAELLEFAKFLTFDAIEIQHGKLSNSGAAATLIAIATKKIPANAKLPPGGPAPGSTACVELTLEFVREAGAWKFDEQAFGGDPDKIERCADESFDPIEAYDRDKDVNLGGPIRRVAFNADHTLVVVRVVDAENCAYLPNRARLESAGFDPDRLVPFAIVNIVGSPHKTDNHKVWIEELSVADD